MLFYLKIFNCAFSLYAYVIIQLLETDFSETFILGDYEIYI